ncbi:MAG: selenium metabolism-associated LysR family transcriptional regulator [Candidatus Velthaea sp.]
MNVLALSQLQTFRQLARDRNFTRAAEALHLTQPAVSQQVRALERHFRVKLVDVAGRRMKLTEAGAFLASRTDLLLAGVAALEHDMREYADAQIGELRLGATVTIGSYGLGSLVARFRRRHPRISLDVRVANTSEIAHGVRTGSLSLALVEGSLVDPALDITPYAPDELVMIAPNEHRFAAAEGPLVPADIGGEAFVAREIGSGTRALFEEVLRGAGVEPNVVLALPTGEGIVQAVEAGVGIAIVSELVTRSAVESGRVRRIALASLDFRRSFRLVRLKDVTASPAALAFAAMVLEPESDPIGG